MARSDAKGSNSCVVSLAVEAEREAGVLYAGGEREGSCLAEVYDEVVDDLREPITGRDSAADAEAPEDAAYGGLVLRRLEGDAEDSNEGVPHGGEGVAVQVGLPAAAEGCCRAEGCCCRCAGQHVSAGAGRDEAGGEVLWDLKLVVVNGAVYLCEHRAWEVLALVNAAGVVYVLLEGHVDLEVFVVEVYVEHNHRVRCNIAHICVLEDTSRRISAVVLLAKRLQHP